MVSYKVLRALALVLVVAFAGTGAAVAQTAQATVARSARAMGIEWPNGMDLVAFERTLRGDDPRQMNYGVSNLGRFTSLTAWRKRGSLMKNGAGDSGHTIRSIGGWLGSTSPGFGTLNAASSFTT